MSLGQEIRRIRKEKGLTQEELGQRIGSQHSYICMIERDKTNLSISSLKRLAQALGVEPADLLGGRRQTEPPPKNYLNLPVVGETTAGGAPSILESQSTEYISLPRELIPNPEGSFVFRVEGDSMKNEGITHGDMVLVERTQEVANKNLIVAVIFNKETTLKRYYKKENLIILQPSNPEFEPIIIKDPSDIFILGRVVKLIKLEDHP